MSQTNEAVARFIRLLKGEKFGRSTPMFEQACVVLNGLPADLPQRDKDTILHVMRDSFSLSAAELAEITTGSPIELVRPEGAFIDSLAQERILWELIPPESLLGMYARYTEHSEPPLAYHVFSCLSIMGCVVNRRVWMDMIHFKIFPCLGVMILGPSGTKKTSATDIAVGMLQDLNVTKIYSEKLTPEALVEAMKDMAQGLVYAPEMVTFLNKQRYNEGLIPLLTRFMDCPSYWESGTIMRGQKALHDVAVSTLFGSTEDWFINNTPEDTFGGGFFARHIIIEQETPTRSVAIPHVVDAQLRQHILNGLAELHTFSGPFMWAPDLKLYFETAWYKRVQKKGLTLEHPLMSTYYQRKPSHTLRLAMLLHLSSHKNMILCLDCFRLADQLLDWAEQFLPILIRRMFKSPEGQDNDFVTRVIRSVGGIIDHSELIQRTEHRMSLQRLRSSISTLKEANRLIERVSKLQHIYILQEGNNNGRLG